MNNWEACRAGFFDGEGSISIIRYRRKGKRLNFYLRVDLSNTCFEAVELYHQTYGGNLRYEKHRGNANPLRRWEIMGKVAAEIIRMWKPYLIAHRRRADLALEFALYKANHCREGYKTPPKVVEEMGRYFNRMKLLNEKGSHGR